MPDLLLFVAAEKLLIEEGTQNASVIGILDHLQPSVPQGTMVPAAAVLPFNWIVVSMWRQYSSDDTDLEYEQRIVLNKPDGKSTSIKSDMGFQFVTDKHRNIIRINGFPFAQQGDYELVLSLRSRKPGGAWSKWSQHSVNYPIRVTYRVEE